MSSKDWATADTSTWCKEAKEAMEIIHNNNMQVDDSYGMVQFIYHNVEQDEAKAPLIYAAMILKCDHDLEEMKKGHEIKTTITEIEWEIVKKYRLYTCMRYLSGDKIQDVLATDGQVDQDKLNAAWTWFKHTGGLHNALETTLVDPETGKATGEKQEPNWAMAAKSGIMGAMALFGVENIHEPEESKSLIEMQKHMGKL